MLLLTNSSEGVHYDKLLLVNTFQISHVKSWNESCIFDHQINSNFPFSCLEVQ